MMDGFLKIATGRSIYATHFLLVFMFVAPAAVLTDYVLLDSIAWIMLIILGIFILITGIITRQEAIDSHNWPRVEAKLLSTSLKSNSSSSGGRSYAPEIKCKFRVDNTEYQGTEYDFSASYGAKHKAEAKVQQVKQMQPLLIHYKPSAPEINVIHPGLHSSHYIRIVIGLAAIIMPVLIWSGVIVLK
ncbi:DUF3592 domain-containing protein [Motilimonas sp. KMU-193]|uniref:DUF3592 domain-containing protein n=1 Tax=Motilimonas sp. KMU-193 TaxID=3388668 RepID=UPI00396AFDA2